MAKNQDIKKKRGAKCAQALHLFLKKCGYNQNEFDFKKHEDDLVEEGILVYDPRTPFDFDALLDFMTFEGRHLGKIYWDEGRSYPPGTKKPLSREWDKVISMETCDERNEEKRRSLDEKIFLWSFALDWWEKEKDSIKRKAQAKKELKAAHEKQSPAIPEPRKKSNNTPGAPCKYNTILKENKVARAVLEKHKEGLSLRQIGHSCKITHNRVKYIVGTFGPEAKDRKTLLDLAKAPAQNSR